jgi:endonuclease-3
MSTPARPAATRPRGRESKKARAERLAGILRRLAERYPAPQTALNHTSAYELLVATILSAQSTDETVNKVVPALFRRCPTPADLAAIDRSELEALIYQTGFYRQKAKSLQGAAEAIVARFGGEVPETMEDLVTLPGVGRKTANVVLGSFFDRHEGVVVDTHVTRLTARLKLTRETTPATIERDLMGQLPQEEWTPFSHRLILFGRDVCKAKDPRCHECELAELCPSAFAVGRWAPAKAPAKARRAAARSASDRTRSKRSD